MSNSEAKLDIAPGICLDINHIRFDAMRARGAGGQNVNKVSSAIHLRYDLNEGDLPERVKSRLRNSGDSRITAAGVVVIRADRYRTQEANRRDALERLVALLRSGVKEPRRRIATKPTKGSKERRLKKKGINSKNKQLRKKPKVD